MCDNNNADHTDVSICMYDDILMYSYWRILNNYILIYFDIDIDIKCNAIYRLGSVLHNSIYI